jgi:ABC-type glycerol-3-phosphate transport system substrate-binding protein
MKRILSSALLLFFLSTAFLTTACFRKKGENLNPNQVPPVTLTMYGLFDSEDVYLPMIQAYQQTHPNVTVLYKRFLDPDYYMDLIVNELAEGKGPDIFFLQNSLLPKHYKKLTAAPDSVVNPEVFRSMFVDVTAKDLIIPNDQGVEKVFALPLYVDTLALFYNKDHLEDAVPTRGKPGVTWDEIKQDVIALTKQDQSFERFERAGIAMGRTDNLLRGFDILLTLMLQFKVNLYDETLQTVAFKTDSNAMKAFDLFTSFALPSQRNYSWNKNLADPNSPEKEIASFATGKLSMVLGYSYLYDDIVTEINRRNRVGEKAISVNAIKVQEVPQVLDPATSIETREVYASYFAPVVSRTSLHSQEAWEFLATMVEESQLKNYFTLTHRPSALRSLITEQEKNPIYGVFASQVGYAESFPMSNPKVYQTLFYAAVDSLLATARTDQVIKTLAEQLQTYIPSSGIKPTQVVQVVE